MENWSRRAKFPTDQAGQKGLIAPDLLQPSPQFLFSLPHRTVLLSPGILLPLPEAMRLLLGDQAIDSQSALPW